jgi:lactoylglutathione lyase
MKIEHIAIWVNNIEAMKHFYVHYFGMACNNKYVNPKKRFESYFLSFGDGATRIELMQRADIAANTMPANTVTGLAHFAISVGSSDEVNKLTEKLRADGYTIAGEPRFTGDGYYESVILDPEGNCIEITI